MKRPFFDHIHKEGYVFAFLFLLVAILLWYVHPWLGKMGALLTAWCLYFFRNPNRVVPQRKGLIISPADGVVQLIQTVMPPKELGLGNIPLTRVSVFMNVFNVHVNRAPVAGTVETIYYHKGRFLNAELDKASDHNERQLFCVKTDTGQKIGFVQIAGLVARRIRCDIREGQKIERGQRFGLIRFGSRVDVFLPNGVSPLVALGQTTIAGETVLGDLQSREKAREGKVL